MYADVKRLQGLGPAYHDIADWWLPLETQISWATPRCTVCEGCSSKRRTIAVEPALLCLRAKRRYCRENLQAKQKACYTDAYTSAFATALFKERCSTSKEQRHSEMFAEVGHGT